LGNYIQEPDKSGNYTTLEPNELGNYTGCVIANQALVVAQFIGL